MRGATGVGARDPQKIHWVCHSAFLVPETGPCISITVAKQKLTAFFKSGDSSFRLVCQRLIELISY